LSKKFFLDHSRASNPGKFGNFELKSSVIRSLSQFNGNREET